MRSKSKPKSTPKPRSQRAKRPGRTQRPGRAKRKVQVWLFDRDLRSALLLKTTAERGAYLQPVTGKVDRGERVPAGARRELAEETGLAGEQMEWLGASGLKLEFTNRHGAPVREEVFAARLRAEVARTEIEVDPREHVSFGWFGVREVEAHLRFETNRDGFRSALTHARARLKRRAGRGKSS